MTMVDGVSETETTYDGSDLPLLESPPVSNYCDIVYI